MCLMKALREQSVLVMVKFFNDVNLAAGNYRSLNFTGKGKKLTYLH